MFSAITAARVLDRWGPLAQTVSENPPLLLAFVAQESGGNPQARRPEPHIGDESRGLAQILAATLDTLQREEIAPGVPRVSPYIIADQLFEPEINLTVADALIVRQVARYSGRLEDAIASYNVGMNLAPGSPRLRQVPDYVTGVLAYYHWFLDHWTGQPPLGPEPPPQEPPPQEPPETGTPTAEQVGIGLAGVVIFAITLFIVSRY